MILPPSPKSTSQSRNHDQHPRGEPSPPPDPQCSIDRMYDQAWDVLFAATRTGARPRARPLAILRRGPGGHVCRKWEVNSGLGWWPTWLHAGVSSMPAAMGGRACPQLAVMPVAVSSLRDPYYGATWGPCPCLVHEPVSTCRVHGCFVGEGMAATLLLWRSAMELHVAHRGRRCAMETACRGLR